MTLVQAFAEGALAGYGIAIPVGAIAVLIVELGLRRGFAPALAAAGGAATADLLYATLAALAGPVAARALAPFSGSLRILSALVLAAIALRGLWRMARPAAASQATSSPSQHAGARVYLQFLGLTLLNPLTVAYFGALILGRSTVAPLTLTAGAVFALGAGLASLSWQIFLAAASAGLGRRVSGRAQRLTSLLGHGIVLVLAVRLLLSQ